jgi:hypothetical protein
LGVAAPAVLVRGTPGVHWTSNRYVSPPPSRLKNHAKQLSGWGQERVAGARLAHVFPHPAAPTTPCTPTYLSYHPYFARQLCHGQAFRVPARLAAVTCKFWLTCSPTCSRAPCVTREHCLKITDDATFRSVPFPAALEPVASRLPPRIVPSCCIELEKKKEKERKKKKKPGPSLHRTAST